MRSPLLMSGLIAAAMFETTSYGGVYRSSPPIKAKPSKAKLKRRAKAKAGRKAAQTNRSKP